MSKTIIRYTVRANEVKENIALLRAFIKELAIANPPGLVYETYLMEDGMSFVHVVESANGPESFSSLSSYRRFRDTVAARCNTSPEMLAMEEVGTYRGVIL
jgi:hypothetical protein